MKKIYCLLVLIVMMFCGRGVKCQGIKFEKGDWNSVLQKAKKEKKMIFVVVLSSKEDHYTDIVIKNRKVGKFYNQHYINYEISDKEEQGKEILQMLSIKFYREKDDETPELIDFGKKIKDTIPYYMFAGYPKFLFIDTNQVVQDWLNGVTEPSVYIETGKKVLSPENRLEYFVKNYKSGKRNSEFLKSYIDFLWAKNYNLNKDFVTEYLSIVRGEQLITKENYYLIVLRSDIDNEAFQYLRKNQEKYYPFINKKKVDEDIYRAYYFYIRNNIKKYSLNEIKDKVRTSGNIYTDKLLAYADIKYHIAYGYWEEFTEEIIEYKKKYYLGYDELSEFIAVYEWCIDDKKLLETGIMLTKEMVNRFDYRDYYGYAEMLYKAGGKQHLAEAEKYADKLRKRVLKKKYNTTAIDKLLDKIHKKMREEK